MKFCAIALAVVMPLCALVPSLSSADEHPSDDPFLSLLGNIFAFPFQVSYKLFSPLDVEDLSTEYRRSGFSQKDQDYFQLNWYAERRMGYSHLFERKELEEQIQREGFGAFRDR